MNYHAIGFTKNLSQGLPIQDGQPHIRNFPLKMVSLISKALIIIFWPDKMRLEIRKCIGICKVLQSVTNTKIFNRCSSIIH